MAKKRSFTYARCHKVHSTCTSKIKSHHSNFVRCSFACFVDALCFTQSSNTNSHHTDKLYSEIVWAEIQAKVRGRALTQFCCHRSVEISAVILGVLVFCIEVNRKVRQYVRRQVLVKKVGTTQKPRSDDFRQPFLVFRNARQRL